jgi:hypothetical protein
MHSTYPASLLIVVVIALLAVGYFGGREYVRSRRSYRRNWK